MLSTKLATLVLLLCALRGHSVRVSMFATQQVLSSSAKFQAEEVPGFLEIPSNQEQSMWYNLVGQKQDRSVSLDPEGLRDQS